jgi:hypothetical protein
MHLSISKGTGTTTWNLSWNGYEGAPHTSYAIYRGSSPQALSMIAQIEANPYNSYTDKAAPTGTVYYAIGLADGPACTPSLRTTGGQSISSNMASNQGEGKEPNWTAIEVYPNPSSAEGTTVLVSNRFGNGRYELVVTDLAGRVLASTAAEADTPTSIAADIEPGIYLIRAVDKSGTKAVARWIVQ